LLPEKFCQLPCLPVPALVGFLLSLGAFPLYIKYLKKRQIGQFIREEGPASHAVKASTPTMGGACFALCAFLSAGACLWAAGSHNLMAAAVLLVSLGCGLVGLVDDLSKLQKKANAGVSGWLRLALEAALGLLLGALMLQQGSGSWLSSTFAPWEIPLPVLAVGYLFFTSLVMASTTNAVNLHDGMDGLAAGTSILILITSAVMLALQGQSDYAIIAAAVTGSVAGFWIYNRYPAKIFMGDTGSLFLGGVMAALAIAAHLEIFIIPLLLIYILETLSVIAQVLWFKLTKPYPGEEKMPLLSVVRIKLTKKLPGEGKRLFRMAPLHHHFEAVAAERGMAEWQVVSWFWLAQLLVCLMVLAVFFQTALR